jgi:Leucine-rich repeat (LRR) protein
MNGAWPRREKVFFLCGLVPYAFQICFLWLLITSQILVRRGTRGEIDNPVDDPLLASAFFKTFIPAGSQRIVRITQFVAILYFVIFPDASQKDIVTGVMSLPRRSKVKPGDRVLSMRFSCGLRLLSGFSGVFATLVLIITATTVVDIVLNFTAITFISKLDDYAFELCAQGEFGKSLQAEAERIAITNLPRCMRRERIQKHIYIFWVKAVLLVALLVIMTMILVWQNYLWVSQSFRVQFDESSGLKEYSGCYKVNGLRHRHKFFLRNTYSSEIPGVDAAVGYCRDERTWLIYESTIEKDPCKIEDYFARSEETDNFDISSSFFDDWVTASNTPIELFFFPEGTQPDELFCGRILGDGICDHPNLNTKGFKYDEGDCCAATCVGSACGYGQLTTVFDVDTIGDGFGNCINPDMKSITINLTSIISSRDVEFLEVENSNWFLETRTDENEFRNETPVNPYFSLECDSKNVLTLYVNKTMMNHAETVKVIDGATCTLVVQNTTSRNPDPEIDDAIWYINYTLYHGDSSYIDLDNKNVEILTHRSSEVEVSNFKRIPDCFFGELNDHVDIENIYNTSDASNTAIDWLINDNTGNSQCGEENFIERFALIKVFFALNVPGEFMDYAGQCNWQSITCNSGKVNSIDLKDANLEEDIPSEIGLLQSVKELQLSRNSFTFIPIEISRMPSLTKLSLFDNKIESIPTAIENMTSLEVLSLYDNEIQEIPAEIGMMIKLQELVLSGNDISLIPKEVQSLQELQILILDVNKISVIPSEIGDLAKLQELSLDKNRFSSLPTEIGKLENLGQLFLFYNLDLSLLPTEIGGLKSLVELDLFQCKISSLPTEVGNMQSLQILDIWGNGLVSLPTEIGHMTSLQELDLGYNELVSLPAEIGRMASLQNLGLEGNKVGSLPSEIGMLTSLRKLMMDDNEVEFLPTEIGEMKSLQEISFYENEIVSLPSEIGMLTNLKLLKMQANEVNSLPTEIGGMISLQEIDLYKNNIPSVPSEIGNISQLQRLFLDWNSVTSIPKEIGSLKDLLELHLRGNQISSLPTEVGWLSNLELLMVAVNSISSIPTEIGGLSSLESVYMFDNSIQSIPSEIGLLTSITSLYLHVNDITSVPSEIGLLTNLKNLYLYDNKITSLPTEIGLLTDLELLQLHDNHISSFPSELGQLAYLKTITTYGNNYTDKEIAIPEELDALCAQFSWSLECIF